ncbi:MAG: hypothetical protein HN337_09180 [Deltaproteobacteria bacterium]|jgi:hypothetical protein|nr:hypothetical protein [Deltaproteobacteria bacterium]
MKKLGLLVAIMTTVAFAACGGGSGSGGGGGDTTETALEGLSACQTVASEGVICGTAYAPDGQTPIVGAEVSLMAASAMVANLKGLSTDDLGALTADSTQCLTDDTGAFACAGIADSGSQDFQIVGGGFTINFSADIILGNITEIAGTDTTATGGSGTYKYAVVLGSWDSIEDVLGRVLQCGTITDGALEIGTECENIEIIGGYGTNPNTALTEALGIDEGTYPTLNEFLTSENSLTAMQTFRGIFFNCGLSEALVEDATAQANLQAYVSGGGNFYASDYAYLYVENNWPEAIDWYGDDAGDNARDGEMNPAQSVNVDDAGLLAWLRAEELIAEDASTFNVNFNLGSWVVMNDTADGTNEIITADSLPNGPADVPIAGRSTLPITVDFSSGSGCVFYTSYHNEPADEVGTDEVQSRVLEYLLLNQFGNCE